ncbi:MAG: aldehyde dehydrogenase [Deltaproteobacteria bacterium]|nr:aldehyde dehydrogenase [Deltaproteobacteria bacterium]
MKTYQDIFKRQQQYFRSGQTLPLKWRWAQLRKLNTAIKTYQASIIEALKADLAKSEMESYVTEIGILYRSIKHNLKHLKQWMKPKKVSTSFLLPLSKAHLHSEPLGVNLIIGPFNFPFQLAIAPLIEALTAGNTAILKPSEFTPHTSAVISKMIAEFFPPEIVSVVEGGVKTVSELLTLSFDHIFFTGSTQVGKIIMKAAAEHLSRVTLELGGKSPVIVDASADIKTAVKRIVWCKFLNNGQVCVAPDYVYVHEAIQEAFIIELKATIKKFYGDHLETNPDYGRIINQRHTNRLIDLIKQETVILGGNYDLEKKFIAPTLLFPVTWESPVMQQEIFGPILPILTYTNIETVISTLQNKTKPLALYLFTKNKKIEAQITRQLSFGGGCINDTLNHVGLETLPFGGIGDSGIGHYHGEFGFKQFSHIKSILKRSTWLDLPFIYPPFSNKKFNFIQKILR